MPVWILALVLWTALGLFARANRPISHALVRFAAQFKLAKWIIGTFLFPAVFVLTILRLLWIRFAFIVDPIFGGRMFKSLRMTRIWYQIGIAMVANESRSENRDPDLWGLQRHINRGWGEEVAICVSDALVSEEFHGWMYCALLHRLSLAVERDLLSADSLERVREAVAFCVQNRSGELHLSPLSVWADRVLQKIDAAEGSA